MLVEFLEKYFHEKCLEIFKNSKNGKEWIDEQEQNKKQKEMFLERCKQIRAIVKKYDNVFSDPIEEFNNFAYFTTTTNYDKQIDAFLNADMKKFTSYVEDFYNSELKKKKKAEEEYNKRQEEQKQQERQKKEAEEQERLEAEQLASLRKKTRTKIFLTFLLLTAGLYGYIFFTDHSAMYIALFFVTVIAINLMARLWEKIIRKGGKAKKIIVAVLFTGLVYPAIIGIVAGIVMSIFKK